MTVPQNRTAARALGTTYQYDDPNDCENCGDPWDEEPIEHVDGRPGWKCMTCRWWNWLPKRGAAS